MIPHLPERYRLRIERDPMYDYKIRVIISDNETPAASAWLMVDIDSRDEWDRIEREAGIKFNWGLDG